MKSPFRTPSTPLDLQPAQWLWYPSERTLANTFVLFRREISLPRRPLRARGWLLADSRYLLHVNGRRVQWGPAPADPRFPEADPLDLTEHLQPGDNVLAVTVLYYGHGDGTWPMGKPGFIFRLELEQEDAPPTVLVSDQDWRCLLPRSWKPGAPKRWYLRALQEEFDARLHPDGWDRPGYAPDRHWLVPLVLNARADQPSIASDYRDYLFDSGVSEGGAPALRARSISALLESHVPARRLVEAFTIDWHRPAEEYFAMQPPGAYTASPLTVAANAEGWSIELPARGAAALTFDFAEQLVGWPGFELEAPAGTIVELLVHEAHQPGQEVIINSHFHSWSRFITSGGRRRYETFDYECFRWVQLHVRSEQPARLQVHAVGARRRRYPFPCAPSAIVSDERIQRVVAAAANTVVNAAQETIVDGMGRERQQYSGDVGHVLHALHHVYGERRMSARFLTTFSQGLSLDGYFLDCWPAYDRTVRIAQRQVGLTRWGPLLDHSVGFVFDCWHHFLYSGQRSDLEEAYPRLLTFLGFLQRLRHADGLLPVENLGVPTVWIDHDAYQRQRDKTCAFNLYAAAMAEQALAPLCRAFGDSPQAEAAQGFGRQLREAVRRHFWCPRRRSLIVNLPWEAEDGGPRWCDRSLATAILFDQLEPSDQPAALQRLAELPAGTGLSYPANATWRLWALARGGRVDVVLHDLRTRWHDMASVTLNNTIQEAWEARPNARDQWSHCAVAPLYLLHMSVAGIEPLEPGFTRYRVRPQPGDLERFAVTSYAGPEPLRVETRGPRGDRLLLIEAPAHGHGFLLLDPREQVPLGPAPAQHAYGLAAFHLPAGVRTELRLRHT